MNSRAVEDYVGDAIDNMTEGYDPRMAMVIEVDAAKYNLEDGEEGNRTYPSAFEIPDADQRNNIAPGMVAKLIFKAQNGDRTRVWAEVIGSANGHYSGSVVFGDPETDLGPQSDLGIDAEDLLEFEARHVFDIAIWDDDGCLHHR